MVIMFPDPDKYIIFSTITVPCKRYDTITLLTVFNKLLNQSMKPDFPNRKIIVSVCTASLLIIQTKQDELGLQKNDFYKHKIPADFKDTCLNITSKSKSFYLRTRCYQLFKS